MHRWPLGLWATITLLVLTIVPFLQSDWATWLFFLVLLLFTINDLWRVWCWVRRSGRTPIRIDYAGYFHRIRLGEGKCSKIFLVTLKSDGDRIEVFLVKFRIFDLKCKEPLWEKPV